MTVHSHRYARRAATAALIALAAGTVTLSITATLPAHALARATPTPASPAELTAALTRTGLLPDALAAAGVTSQQTAAVVLSVEQELQEGIESVRSAEESLRLAKAEHSRLQRLVRSGQATAEDVADLQTAAGAVASAQGLCTSLDQGIFDAATENLTAAQIQTLQTIRANRPQELPTRYLVEDRSEPDWVALTQALANQRIALDRGESPSPLADQIVLEADSTAPSAAAQANLDANLAAVEAAWAAALTE